MIVRAVVFDFNGILADDDPIHMRAFRQVAQEEGLSFSEEDYLNEYLPLNDRDCFQHLWKSNNRTLRDGELDELIRRKGVYYYRAIDQQPVLFKGADEAIRAAARRGPVGIASGARGEEIRHILGAAGLLDCFVTVVAAEDVVHGKPHPEPFQLAHARLKAHSSQLRPQDCLAVEDSIGGIQSARDAGLPCLGVAHSYTRDKLEGKAQWVIDSISDFGDWLNRL